MSELLSIVEVEMIIEGNVTLKNLNLTFTNAGIELGEDSSLIIEALIRYVH
jgi:hypothetical protein